MELATHLLVVDMLEPLPSERPLDIVMVHVVGRALVHDHAFAVREVHKPVPGKRVDICRSVVREPPGPLLVVPPLVVSSVVDGGFNPSKSSSSRWIQPIPRRHIISMVTKKPTVKTTQIKANLLRDVEVEANIRC